MLTSICTCEGSVMTWGRATLSWRLGKEGTTAAADSAAASRISIFVAGFGEKRISLLYYSVYILYIRSEKEQRDEEGLNVWYAGGLKRVDDSKEAIDILLTRFPSQSSLSIEPSKIDHLTRLLHNPEPLLARRACPFLIPPARDKRYLIIETTTFFPTRNRLHSSHPTFLQFCTAPTTSHRTRLIFPINSI
jgi:hypothetical protein